MSIKTEYITVHLGEHGTLELVDFQIMQSGIDSVLLNRPLTNEQKRVFYKASGVAHEASRQISNWGGVDGAKKKVRDFDRLGFYTQADGLRAMIRVWEEINEVNNIDDVNDV